MGKLRPLTIRDVWRCYDRVLADQPINEHGIIMRRGEDDTVITNVPHVAVHHSPDGYEFAFGGSGPSDLAMNIVAEIFRVEGWNGGEQVACYRGSVSERVWALHQPFKWEFIATAPRAGTVIPYETARNWLREKMDEEAGV